MDIKIENSVVTLTFLGSQTRVGKVGPDHCVVHAHVNEKVQEIRDSLFVARQFGLTIKVVIMQQLGVEQFDPEEEDETIVPLFEPDIAMVPHELPGRFIVNLIGNIRMGAFSCRLLGAPEMEVS